MNKDFSHVFTELLGVRWPLIQAPMAGISTPALAAAVSEEGALGSIAISTISSEKSRELIHQTRALTTNPFNVNAFVHTPSLSDSKKEAQWLERLRPWFAEFGVEPPSELHTPYRSLMDDLEKQQVLLEEAPAVVSFHFGLPKIKFIQQLQSSGSRVIACVTTVPEALEAEAAGVDMIVAQGFEAGGHRGTFDPHQDEQLGTLALIPQVVRAVDIPVIAAGGIASGGGIIAAMALGACGVQVGTAFVGCLESAASESYRKVLASDQALRTQVTRAISGRPARGILNRFIVETQGDELKIPGYPQTYHAGKALAEAAGQYGSTEFLGMWAGQAAGLADSGLPAGAVVKRLVQEAQEISFSLLKNPWTSVP